MHVLERIRNHQSTTPPPPPVKYFVVDGDGIGNMAAVPLLNDDEATAVQVSNKIHTGQRTINRWVTSHGGTVLIDGGDNSVFKLPAEAASLEAVERLRQAYLQSTGFTLSVGMGDRLSQADKSLLVAKHRGKDCTVVYDETVEEEFTELRELFAEDPLFQIPTPLVESLLLTEGSQRFRVSRGVARRAAIAFKTQEKGEHCVPVEVRTLSRMVRNRTPFRTQTARRLVRVLRRYTGSRSCRGRCLYRLLGGRDALREVQRFLDGQDKV